MYDPNLQARRALEAIHEKKMPLKCIVGVDSMPEVNNKECPFEEQNFTEEELQQHIRRNDGEVEKPIALVKEFPKEIISVYRE